MTLKDKAEKAAIAYYAVDRAWGTANTLKNYVRGKFVHSVTISSKDYVYKDLQQWIFDNSPAQSQKALVAESTYYEKNPGILETVPDKNQTNYKLNKLVNTNTTKKFTYKGFDYTAYTTSPDKVNLHTSSFVSLEPEKLVISTYSKAGQEAVFDLIQDIINEKSKSVKIVQLKTERYDEWHGKPLQKRSIDSVFLAKGQKERLSWDIENFLNAEPDYLKFNIPYHRGYLLYGCPGSGKTSTVKALAHYFSMDIYYLSLSEVKRDTSLLRLINQVEPRSILLLEDIDVLSVTNGREGNESDGDELTLTGLLNALDGVGTPHGLLYFMTTNEPDKLDDALVRTGRVDVKEHIDYCNEYQVSEAFKYFYNRPLTKVPTLDKMSLADVMEIFKQHMYNADAAEAALMEGIKNGGN